MFLHKNASGSAELAAFLDEVLPTGCTWAACSDFTCDPPLTCGEVAYVARCHPKRAAEFRAGRNCAQAALAVLKAPTGPLDRREDGLPCWPEGHLGSITHCSGLCLAVAARQTAIIRLGCDAEPNKELPLGIAPQVLLPKERAAQAVSDLPDTLWFSAKEAVFKAVYPSVRHFFGFEEATVTVGANGRFSATLSDTIAIRTGTAQIAGHWWLSSQHIVTIVAT